MSVFKAHYLLYLRWDYYNFFFYAALTPTSKDAFNTVHCKLKKISKVNQFDKHL